MELPKFNAYLLQEEARHNKDQQAWPQVYMRAEGGEPLEVKSITFDAVHNRIILGAS